MKYRIKVIVLCAVIAVALVSMMWGAIHTRQKEGEELAVYTRSEYNQLKQKYDENSRQLAGYMTKYETLVTQLSSARTDCEKLQNANTLLQEDLTAATTALTAAQNAESTLTVELEDARAYGLSLTEQLETARSRAAQAESTVRQMTTDAAEKEMAIGQLTTDLEETQTLLAQTQTQLTQTQTQLTDVTGQYEEAAEALACLRSFESAALPLGFAVPDDCGAAEVGGWIYISRRDNAAQAVIRRYEAEKGMDRDDIVEYMLSLSPEEEGELAPAVSETEFEGGEYSRFALQYTDSDGIEMYGEFCVLEIEGEYFCLEAQSLFENREAASALTDGLLESLYGRTE